MGAGWCKGAVKGMEPSQCIFTHLPGLLESVKGLAGDHSLPSLCSGKPQAAQLFPRESHQVRALKTCRRESGLCFRAAGGQWTRDLSLPL